MLAPMRNDADTDWRLLDLVAAPVLVRSAAGSLLHCNPAACRLYGMEPAQLGGQALDRVLDSFGVPRPAALWQALQEGGGQARAVCRRRSATGVSLTLALHWHAWLDAEGELLAVVETAIELGEGQGTASALAQSEYRYRNLFHAMAASFWELDFSAVGAMLKELRRVGVTDMGAHFARFPEVVAAMLAATRVLDVNLQSQQLFRLSGSVVGGDIAAYWPQDSWPVYAASVLAAISGASSFAAETRLRRADGSEFAVWFTACFAPETVAAGRLLIGILDISARVQAQDQARQLQDQLAHAARVALLGELTASIAHEINQPLAAIAAHGAAALRWLDRGQPDLEEVHLALQHTVSDARRAADIIKRTRALAQHRVLTRTALDIAAVVRDALGFLDHTLRAQRVRVHTELAPRLPAVHADRVQLQQVLVNLLVNALQALAGTPSAQPALWIRTALTDDAADLLIQVDDNGPGIDPALLPNRLFESFRSTRPDGLGLGLAVARSIVEVHGGRIEASNRTSGARLKVILPIAPHSGSTPASDLEAERLGHPHQLGQ